MQKLKINFVDFWNNFDKGNNHFVNILSKYYQIEISTHPDFLFCSCFGHDHLNYSNCVKIFTTQENMIPDFNLYDYAIGYHYLDFGDRYFQQYYAYPSKIIQNRENLSHKLACRRFCNFIYSNNYAGEGAYLRQEFCKKLAKYKKIDCPGKVLNNMTAPELEPRGGNWEESKIKFLNKYKFTIAFENSSSEGYVTDKLFDPVEACSIPIYWGDPSVSKRFNTKAFINCVDFDYDFDRIIQKVIELDKNDDLYMKMLKEKPMAKNFDFDHQKKLENWLLNIIKKGNKPYTKDPLHFSERTHFWTTKIKIHFLGITFFFRKEDFNQITYRILGIQFKIQKRNKNARNFNHYSKL